MTEGNNYVQLGDRRAYVRIVDGRVDNIGYVIFPEPLRQSDVHQVFLDFIERYFMLLNYPAPDYSVRHMLRDDRFEFLTGSTETVARLRTDDAFGYTVDDKSLYASWTREGREILKVSFPLEYQLLLGVDKKEAEEGFALDLQRMKPAACENLTELDLATLTTTSQYGYFVKEGAWYLKKDISANTYYWQDKNARCHLVCDVSHPAESVANMMLKACTEGDYDLDVTQVVYGFTNKRFVVALRQWLALCRAKDCTLYVGIESVDNDEVQAAVFAVNEQEYYNHVMSVTVPLTVIDEQQGTIKARLHTYVPMHNALMVARDHQKPRNKNKKIYE